MKKQKASRTTGAKRLLKLAALLEALPEQRFDYCDWVGNDWKGKPDLSCGTTACALGWATTIPSLRKLGLELVEKHDSWVRGGGEVVLTRKGERKRFTFDAAATVFGITYQEAEFLFSPGSSVYFQDDWGYGPHEEHSPFGDATAQEVAEHIQNFVRKHMLSKKTKSKK